MDSCEVYEFPAGLPAFETERSFRLEAPQELAPLRLLVSQQSPGLRFVCTPASVLMPGYAYCLDPSESELLSESASAPRPEELECLIVLTFPRDGAPTANLLAPLVLNHETHKGVQSIQVASEYSHVHPLPRVASTGPAEGEEQTCS